MIFVKRLQKSGRTRGFVVERSRDAGWLASEEEDDRILHSTGIREWHRVERMIAAFTRIVRRLQDEGWIEVQRRPFEQTLDRRIR